MYRQPRVPRIAPIVALYPRAEEAEFALTMQVGAEWATVRWKPEDNALEVAARLREAVHWLELR